MRERVCYIILKCLVETKFYVSLADIPEWAEKTDQGLRTPTDSALRWGILRDRALQNYTRVKFSWILFYLKEDRYTKSMNIQE